MASRCWALGCLLVLMLALSCGGVAQRPSPSTESAVAGSSSGGSPGLGGLGAGATSSGGSWPELTTVDPPQAGGPSAPAEFAECRDPRGSSCASHDNYLQIHELRSDGSQVVVQLDWPGGPNCGTCAVFCEDCYFSCELWAQAVQGCGEPNVHVAARNDSNGSVYLDTDSADPHYDDSAGKRWHVLSLIALNTSPSAADAELVDWDLSLTVSTARWFGHFRSAPTFAHRWSSSYYPASALGDGSIASSRPQPLSTARAYSSDSERVHEPRAVRVDETKNATQSQWDYVAFSSS